MDSRPLTTAEIDAYRSDGFTLLDTQWSTPHLAQFGCREIPRDDYLDRLEVALATETEF